MFHSVKDKENLLPYNVWSGSDYTNNIEGFYAPVHIISSSDEWSNQGNKSLKIISETLDYSYTRFYFITATEGDKFNVTLKALNNSGNTLVLRVIETTNSHFQDVEIPSSSETQLINTNFTSTTDGVINFLIITRTNIISYIDCLSVKQE